MNWRALRKAASPDVGWYIFIRDVLCGVVAMIIFAALVLGLALSLDWILVSLLSPKGATIAIVGFLIVVAVYATIVDPIVTRYKMFVLLENKEGRK